MPARNSRKLYQENGYYHLYNRGVEKRKIFLDKQDIGVFLFYLKEYLTEKDEKLLRKRLSDVELSSRERDKILKILRMNNFVHTITLLAYCLMPNHFHFLVKQTTAETIDKFMNSLGTRYTMYFNKKYKRVGHLYQGAYKAVSITTEEQLVHLTRYIHRQALTLQVTLQGHALEEKYTCSTPWKKNTRVHITTILKEEIQSGFIRKKSCLIFQKIILDYHMKNLLSIVHLMMY